MRIRRFIAVMCAAVLLVTSAASPPGFGGVPDKIGITASAEATTITATNNGSYSITSSGEYILTGTATYFHLDINADCTLTIRNLNLNNTANDGIWGICVCSGTTHLFIDGENTIKAGGRGGDAVPIGVEYDATLIIDGKDGSNEGNILNATGTSDGKAAIGGAWDQWKCGTIVINSGTINAVGGGNYSSVIGAGGNISSNRSVTINGGVITCTLINNGGNPPKIGGSNMTATINGGTVDDVNYTVYYCDFDDQTRHDCPNYSNYVGQTTLTTGWYVVRGRHEVSERIEIEGDVTLVLTDGCELIAKQGIHIPQGNPLVVGGDKELTIYGQSNVQSTMGKLTATLADNNPDYAVIGSNGGQGEPRGGVLIICGGKINATNTAGNGAAIGGGDASTLSAVRIEGGYVNAENTSGYGAAIGGGRDCAAESVYIELGFVTATACYGAGIGSGGTGGGTPVDGSDISIECYDREYAEVTASSIHGAGIGAGNLGKCGTIGISNISVNAQTEATGGYGIGGCGITEEDDGIYVTIAMATVNSTGNHLKNLDLKGVSRDNVWIECSVIDGDPFGHLFNDEPNGQPVFNWNQDFTSCTATAPCTNDEDHSGYTETVNCSVVPSWSGNVRTLTATATFSDGSVYTNSVEKNVAYTVTIPATVAMTDSTGTTALGSATVSASDCSLWGARLRVTVTSDHSLEAGGSSVPYTIKKGTTSLSAANSTALTVTNASSGSADLTFEADTSSMYAGTYTDTVTFNIAIEH